MSSSFWYNPLVAVPRSLGGKVPVVDDFLSSHEQEIYLTTLIDENSAEIGFHKDRNYSVGLRRTYSALKLKIVIGRGYETYLNKEVKKERKKEAKADEDKAAEEEQEAPLPLVSHVNNSLHSILFNDEVYINNQQIYDTNGMHADKFYKANNFRALSLNTSEFFTAMGTTLKNSEDGSAFVWTFLHKRMKKLSWPDGFM